MEFQLYKKQEGMWARMPVAIVGGIITFYATDAATKWDFWPSRHIWAGVVFAALTFATVFIAFFHRKMGDILIETESEMRKVVWPTREEVQGSTIVVIATVLILGLSIFVVDVGLASFLKVIGLYQ